MEREISLYIPTGVKAQKELFHGFGKRELGQSAIGFLISGVLVVVHLQKRGSNGCSGTFWYFWKCDDVYQRSE